MLKKRVKEFLNCFPIPDSIVRILLLQLKKKTVEKLKKQFAL